MPKLLLICEYPTLSGGERSMLSTLDGVIAAGFAVHVLAPPNGPLPDRLRSRGVSLVPFPFRDPWGRRLPQIELRGKLADALAKLRPDLVHANSLAMARLAGPVAAELGLPAIGHLRDIIRLSRQAVTDLNRNARLLAVSRAVRQFYLEAGLSAERTHVVYNGVDIRQFACRPPTGYLHRQLGLDSRCPLVGTIGQICLRKGLDTLIRAAAAVASAQKDVHFLVAGQRWSNKEETRRLESRLQTEAERQIPGRLHWLGYRDDVPRLLNELILLVHPAHQEPLGRVLLEAAASGLPIVATDVGGTREIFPPASETARLVPSGDARALANAICELLGDNRLRQTLGSNARRRIEAHFTAEQATAELIRHYRETLAAQAR